MKQQSGYRATRGDTQPPQALLDAWQPSRRDHCGGSDPPEGRGKWWAEGWTTYPSPVAHQRRKRGGRSLHHHPSLAARGRSGQDGNTRGATPLRFTEEDAENPCQPASNEDLQAKPRPQQRGLRPLIVQICNCQNRAPLRAPPPCATPLL